MLNVEYCVIELWVCIETQLVRLIRFEREVGMVSDLHRVSNREMQWEWRTRDICSLNLSSSQPR